ncbi:MAG: hypothetical protein ABI600_12495 [Luteolibacter sp.]
MTFHTIYLIPYRSIRLLIAAVVVLTYSTAVVRAASDTDVTIIKAESVVIEDSAITIIGKGRATARLINADGSSTWMGRTVTSVKIEADKATFVIKRPELNFNDPDGSHAEEKEKTKRMLDEAWASSLATAKELQAGREVGRIGFYAPDISIKGNLIDSIIGFGYLYAKSK